MEKEILSPDNRKLTKSVQVIPADKQIAKPYILCQTK